VAECIAFSTASDRSRDAEIGRGAQDTLKRPTAASYLLVLVTSVEREKVAPSGSRKYGSAKSRKTAMPIRAHIPHNRPSQISRRPGTRVECWGFSVGVDILVATWAEFVDREVSLTPMTRN